MAGSGSNFSFAKGSSSFKISRLELKKGYFWQQWLNWCIVNWLFSKLLLNIFCSVFLDNRGHFLWYLKIHPVLKMLSHCLNTSRPGLKAHLKVKRKEHSRFRGECRMIRMLRYWCFVLRMSSNPKFVSQPSKFALDRTPKHQQMASACSYPQIMQTELKKCDYCSRAHSENVSGMKAANYLPRIPHGMMVGQIHEFVHQVWLIEITSQWTKLLVGRKTLTLESRRDISVTTFSYANAVIAKAIVRSQPKAERQKWISYLYYKEIVTVT